MSNLKAKNDLNVVLATMKPLDRIEFLKTINDYTNAETVDIKDLLGKPIKVIGVLVHDAKINTGNKVDYDTGEITPSYTDAKRTVFKLEDGTIIGFVAISISNYVENFIIPAFGQGNWIDTNGKPIVVTLQISKLQSKGGEIYSTQVLG